MMIISCILNRCFAALRAQWVAIVTESSETDEKKMVSLSRDILITDMDNIIAPQRQVSFPIGKPQFSYKETPKPKHR